MLSDDILDEAEDYFRGVIVCRNGRWTIEVIRKDEEPIADWWFTDPEGFEGRNSN